MGYRNIKSPDRRAILLQQAIELDFASRVLEAVAARVDRSNQSPETGWDGDRWREYAVKARSLAAEVRLRSVENREPLDGDLFDHLELEG